jgi:hypothetical protein
LRYQDSLAQHAKGEILNIFSAGGTNPRKMIDGEIHPARINCATCSMSGKSQAIKSQSMHRFVAL